jgi:polyferredoxin
MKVIRRAEYGFIAWFFVFLLTMLLAAFVPDYVALIAVAAPVAFYWLAIHCLRKKKPDWGSEGLKAGGIWLLVFGIMDFVVMPVLGIASYNAYLSGRLGDIVYFEVVVVPWIADKVMTGLRKI